MNAFLDYAAVTRLVREGIDASMREIAPVGATRLLGYALLTDNDVAGVDETHYVADPLARIADAPTGYALASDLRFRPCEWHWPREMHPIMLEAFEFLARRRRPELVEERLADEDRAFDALVAALESARASGIFGPDVFLSVLCGDPSDTSTLREYGSIRRLNAPAMVRAYHASIRAELVEVLAEVEANPGERNEWRQADLVETMRRDIAVLDAELGGS